MSHAVLHLTARVLYRSDDEVEDAVDGRDESHEEDAASQDDSEDGDTPVPLVETPALKTQVQLPTTAKKQPFACVGQLW